jgi:hypothetical protein
MQIRRATEDDLEALLALNASIQQQHANEGLDAAAEYYGNQLDSSGEY